MSIQHSDKPIFGVQYHPESIATDYGHKILENFVRLI
jgi:anthranilate/para-aminobenzoate synthase component II